MRRISVRVVAAAGLFVSYAALAGPGIPAQAASGAAASPRGIVTAGDWPTYHLNNQRDGDQTRANPVSTLSQQWNAALDGPVYGEPLVADGLVFAATENDTVYALNRTTGAVVWSAHVGSPEPSADLPCGDIDPLGITSTMVYDPDTDRVYTVAELLGGTHTLFGINAQTGAIALQTPIDPPKGDAIAQQQRGALTLLNGRLYIPYGGLYGDCGNYFGQVVSVTTAGTGMESYAIPTTRQGGIWAPAGGVLDNGNLLYVSGNGAATSGTYDGSDSVVELSPSLQQLGFFAPSDWATQNAGDSDLGSVNPAVVGQYVVQGGKSGNDYVLQNGALGGVGGQLSEMTGTCETFGGDAISGSTIYLPCVSGPQALTISSTGTLTQLWHTTAVPAEGSPVIGGGAVWWMDYNGGELYALDPSTGAVKQQIQIGRAPSFTTPTIVGNQVFVGTLTGVVAVAGA